MSARPVAWYNDLMEDTVHIVLGPGGREELFPDMPADWPYLFDRAELDRYPDRS